jgi:hypothetical protein
MATTNSMNYSLDGVPMITYGIIGITTLVLAAVTIMSKDGTAIPATPSPAAPAPEGAAAADACPSVPPSTALGAIPKARISRKGPKS